MTQVYFLCTGNACRSQMAEGFAKKYCPDWRVASAGLEKHGLDARAVRVMAERGLDISAQTSKVIDEAYFASADWIVTLCGDAQERCPVIPATAQHLHWDLPDPAKASGTAEEILQTFREVRDVIELKVKELSNA